MKCALWLLLLGACRFNFDFTDDESGDAMTDVGPPPPPFEPYWRVGTRLRPITLVPIDGGDPYFWSWYDPMLSSACRNGIAADDIERCIPVEVSADEYFADAACTVRLGLERTALCAASNAYASGRDSMGRFHVYPIGAVHTGPVYDGRIGCMLTTPTQRETVYTLGAEVPPSMLLTGQYHKETIGTFVRPFQGLVDGSAIEIGSIEIFGQPCYPRAFGLGPTRCRPTAFRGEPVYRDMQCTQRAYFWDRRATDPSATQTLAVFDAQACETQYRLFQTTGDVTAPQFFRLTTSGCMQATTPADGRLYTATEIADPFPLGTIVAGERRGRLGYLYWVGPDGAAMTKQYYDHDLQVPCDPFVASDGKLRCLPVLPEAFTAHADSTCGGASKPLTTTCFGGTPLAGPDYPSCTVEGSATHVRSPTQIANTASVFVEATCTPINTPGAVYDPSTGATLSPTMFAELMEIVQ